MAVAVLALRRLLVEHLEGKASRPVRRLEDEARTPRDHLETQVFIQGEGKLMGQPGRPAA